MLDDVRCPRLKTMGTQTEMNSVKFSELPFSIGSSMSRKGKPGGSSLSQLDASEASLCEETSPVSGSAPPVLRLGRESGSLGESDPAGGETLEHWKVHVTIRCQLSARCCLHNTNPSEIFSLPDPRSSPTQPPALGSWFTLRGESPGAQRCQPVHAPHPLKALSSSVYPASGVLNG